MRQYRQVLTFGFRCRTFTTSHQSAKKDHEVLSKSERSSRDTGIRIALAFAYFTNMSISIPTSAWWNTSK